MFVTGHDRIQLFEVVLHDLRKVVLVDPFALGLLVAIIRTIALPEKKKEVSGLLLSAALTSMLTGITEPLEFTFLFTAPLLYGIHCVFAGLAYMLMHMLSVGVGMTFSGGLIDWGEFYYELLKNNRYRGCFLYEVSFKQVYDGDSSTIESAKSNYTNLIYPAFVRTVAAKK